MEENELKNNEINPQQNQNTNTNSMSGMSQQNQNTNTSSMSGVSQQNQNTNTNPMGGVLQQNQNMNTNPMGGVLQQNQNMNTNPMGGMSQQNSNTTNNKPNSSGGDTNNKDTVFGTSQDGKTIASARKIKGELIGGYVLFGIPFEIIRYVIKGIINASVSISSYNKTTDELIKITDKIMLLLIPIVLFGIISNLLMVFFSSKATFSKRKIRGEDIQNVLKTTIIIFSILGCLNIFSLVSGYNDNAKNVNIIKEQIKLYQSYTPYSSRSTISNTDDYEQLSVALTKIKNQHFIVMIVGIISNIVSIVLIIILQKKLLEKNAENTKI